MKLILDIIMYASCSVVYNFTVGAFIINHINYFHQHPRQCAFSQRSEYHPSQPRPTEACRGSILPLANQKLPSLLPSERTQPAQSSAGVPHGKPCCQLFQWYPYYAETPKDATTITREHVGNSRGILKTDEALLFLT